MTTLAEFFHGSDTTLGVFYPVHCLVAVFLQEGDARSAGDLLHGAGFAGNDVIVASGRDVIEFEKQETGAAGALMQALSRFFKTEQYYADRDLDLARQGAGFLVVRCANATVKEQAWKIIGLKSPWAARYYGIDGVEHLAGDPDTD